MAEKTKMSPAADQLFRELYVTVNRYRTRITFEEVPAVVSYLAGWYHSMDPRLTMAECLALTENNFEEGYAAYRDFASKNGQQT